MNAVDVKHTAEHEVALEWTSSADNDMIADATLALLTSIDKSPASVKRKILQCHLRYFGDKRASVVTSESLHVHVHADAGVESRYEQIAWFLEAHFGQVELGHESVLIVRVNGVEARVDLMSSVSYRVGVVHSTNGAG